MGEHSEDDRAIPESKKRTVKTRTQVEALEKIYDEHKYPTESMKEELAKSIGLTEKQVSGWFCHRRLKDKRLLNSEAYVNGRQDRSSGTIQDRGSGFRQDSCGSTKQREDRNFEPREVESKRLNCQEFSAPDLPYELGTRYTAMGSHGCPEDTSSGSSSSLRNVSFSHGRDHYAVHSSRNQTQSFAIGMKEMKRRTGPSGYLKVKGQVENSAITAVKKQLGRHYLADGPPLGVEFDSLPPGAFESPVVQPPSGVIQYLIYERCLSYRSSPISYLRYGPFWICTTLIFVAASIGIFVTYVAHKLQNKEWNYGINLVIWSAGLFYGYVTIVPVCLYLILKYFSAPSGLVQLFCLYGYSLFVFIPALCLCYSITDRQMGSCGSSWVHVCNIRRTLKTHIASAGERWFLIVVGIFLLQFALALVLKLYLFTVTV